MTTLAVIVLDCAEHTVLRELAARGRMPVLAALMARGVTVPLRSDGHHLDGSVFQTLLTGANTGKHGIHKYRQIMPGTYDFELAKASRSPVPQIWRVLSDRGRRACVFDVPKAFPIPGLNGKLVAAWGAYAPSAAPGSEPAGLFPELRRRFGRHPQPYQEALPLSRRGYGSVLGRLLEGIRSRGEACRWLLEGGPWDFFITAFSETHVGSHQFWHLRDPSHPLYDRASAEQYGRAMETLYEAVDESAGKILKRLGEGATVVVMTQQGVCHNFTGSHLLPEWLARRQGKAARTPLLFRVTDTLGSRLRLWIKRRLPERVLNRLVWWKSRPRGDVFLLPGSEFSALLRLNLAGREPAGTIPKEAYRATSERLRDDLLQLRNPATGRRAVAQVIFPHDEYHGPCLDTLPDAVVCWQNDHPIAALECPRHGVITGGIKFTDVTHSMHTGEGMAVIAGPDIPRGVIEKRHDLMDMTATWYSLLGEKLPPHVDGAPIALGGAVAAVRPPAIG